MSGQIVSKIWAFCNTLRDDGVGYGDYLEQLPYKRNPTHRFFMILFS